MSIRLSTYLSEGVHDSGKFKAIIMAGGPGAGKSYQIDRISTDSGIIPKVVNIDHPVERLSSRYSDVVQLLDTAERITVARLIMYIAGGLPLIIDSTSANFRVTLHRAELLRNLGYDVGMVYVKSDLHAAHLRNSLRQRNVPSHVVDELHSNIDIHADTYRRVFSSTFFTTIKVDEMDDVAIRQISKKAATFFKQDLMNDIGQRLVDSNKRGNYYNPGTISASVSKWFSAE